MTDKTSNLSAKGLTYYSDSNGCIGTINISTGERTFIGNPNIQFFDIAMNKADQLFGISSSNQLYSINTSTGAARLIGNAGWGINALTSGPDGQLYGVGNGQVYSISEKTGQATKIDCPDISSAGDVVYADGLLYITTTKDQLVTYNLETKETQVLVNNLPGVSTYGISLTADGLIAGVTTNNELYQVNPLDGKVMLTGVKSDGPTVFGLASAQTVLISPVDPKPASGLNDTATVNIDIAPPENRAPDAVDDVIQAKSGEKIEIAFSKLLGNDSDPDGDALTIISVQNAKNGTVEIEGDKVIFTPDAGYTGPAQFEYTISDSRESNGQFTSNQGQVTTLNFENIIGATDKWNYVGLPKGWFTDNPSGIIEVGNQEEYGIKGNNGNKVVEIEAAHGDCNLYTIINSSAGEDVTISFDAAQRVGYWSKVAVLVDGVEVGVIQPTTQVLEGYTFKVIGTGEPMRVEFKSTDSNAFGVVMDNIVINSPNPIGLIDVATVTIDILPPDNQAPNAVDDIIDAQNGVITISPVSLLGNDSDPDGDVLKGVSVQDAVNGNVAFDGTNILFTPTVGYVGSASFTYTISDGKGGIDSAKVNLNVNGSVAPDAPAIAPDMTAPTDTGISNTDNITKDNTPDFAIPNPEGNTPNLYVDGVKVASMYNPSTGTLTPEKPLGDGKHDLQYSLTNPQGQESGLSPTLPVVIDTIYAAGAPKTAPDMTAATDTGPSNTDNNTDDRTPDFAVKVADDNTPSLYVDGIKVPSTYNQTAGTLTPNSPIADGDHTISYSLTDAAGNESPLSPALPIVIGSQNQAPDAVDDQIVSNQDGQIVILPSQLLGNDSDPNGDVLQGVSVQNAQNGTVKFDGANVVFTPIVGYAGPASFTYTISDGKGGFDTAKVDLVVDGRVTPDAPKSAPDMTAATDTGVSDSDDLTKDTTPNFAVQVPVGHTPNLYIDGGKVASTYDPVTKTLTPIQPLEEGPHAVSYTLTSPQGKESGLSPNLPILIDATAPQTPVSAPDMTSETDTGIKNDDDDTDDRTPSFKVGEIGDNSPALYVDGVKVPATYDAAKGTLTPNTPIADGPHEVTYTLTDPAGNESMPSPKLPIVIGSQNQAPDAVDDMIAVNYVGPIEIDILTLLSNDIDVDGDKLQGVSVQDAQNGSVEVQGDKLIFTPDSGFEGVASFTYTVSDGKGGIDTATVNLNINISAPDAPANAPDMTAATDTGISDTDNLTKLEMPDFAIANPGDHIVTLYIDGTPYPAEYNPAKGVITPIAALEDGQYQISYTLKDPVTGKESAMSPVLLIEVDNDIYQPLTPVDMTDETDTGMSNTDNITSDATPDFAVEVPDNSTPSLIVDGVKVEAIYDADKGTLTPKSPLADGPHEVSYSLMDAAGNESAPSPALTVVIGEVNQNKNLIMNGSFEDVTGLAETFYGFAGQGEVPYWTDSKGLTIDIHNDQRDGVKPTDGTNWADLGGLNSDNRIGQNVLGVVEGQSYKLEFDAGDIRTADDGKAGDNLVTVYWGGEAIATINPPDGSMSHYEFNLIGGAGNGSNRLEFAGSGKLDNFGVSIDKISLVSQANTTLTAADMTAQTDSGISDTDNLTNLGTPHFVIEATDGRTPILYVDGKPVETTFDVDTSTVTPVNPLPEGPHQISYKLVDGLGNESPLSQPLNIMIDTQAPQISGVADMIDASDDGVSNQDDITTETKPSFAIEPAGENIPSLYVDGVKVPASYDAKNGTLTPVEPLSQGNHAISYSLTDPAGNESAPSLPLPIEIRAAFDVPQENKAPDAQDDVIVGEQDHAIIISPSELLGNDSDPDGDHLQGVSLQDPVNGTVYFDGQNVIFTPTTGYEGPASFTYTISDGKGGFDTATVNLTVESSVVTLPNNQNQDADAKWDTISGTQSGPLVINPADLLRNDKDADGDTFEMVSVQNGVNGSVSYENGMVIFTPNPGYSGPASFTYTITDGKGGWQDVATVNLMIAAVATTNGNYATVTGDDGLYLVEHQGLLEIKADTILSNDVDVEGDNFSITNLSSNDGTVQLVNGVIQFTPNANVFGDASVQYTVTDNVGNTSQGLIQVSVLQAGESLNVQQAQIGQADLFGSAANDMLLGDAQNNVLNGGAGNDAIVGGAGDDTIIGGAGNDILTGGVGADTFSWSLSDTQGAGVEVDVIKDFDQNGGNDVINLKDLLVGESQTAESLANYLHFDREYNSDYTEVTGTRLYVSSEGKLSGDHQVGHTDEAIVSNTTQQIFFEGVDLTAGATSDLHVIQNLLSQNKLITD